MPLSRFIRTHLDDIVAEWEAFARTLVPEEHMTALALRDHCRDILLGVADDVDVVQTTQERAAKSHGLEEPAAGGDTAATTHGELRQVSGFNLIQLVAEFRALRASVLALWQRSAEFEAGASAHDESMRFNEAIDKALAESVESYSTQVASSRDMFLAILGHDLRAPLAVISVASTILAKPDLTPAAKERAAAGIKRASQEMGRLITDLLEYTRSRLGAGIPVERSACDLGRICEETIESIRMNHPEQSFDLRVSGDLHIDADGARLQQALSNLLNNAVQHGDRQAAVSLQADGGGDDVVLRVRNFGRPIRANVLPTLFEPLIQAPAGAAPNLEERSKTSLGLGLFIVREIVLGHDGTIDVESSEHTGTVFTARLPRRSPAGSRPQP